MNNNEQMAYHYVNLSNIYDNSNKQYSQLTQLIFKVVSIHFLFLLIMNQYHFNKQIKNMHVTESRPSHPIYIYFSVILCKPIVSILINSIISPHSLPSSK